jgi:glycogen debranching enzyme
MKILWLTIYFSTITLCQQIPARIPITANEMMISVEKDSSREVAYSNKEAGVFYTETNGDHRSGWQGWRIMSTEMMEDYSISVDGRRLNKKNATARVYPHQIIREYPDGIEERMTLLDSIDALVVELSNVAGKQISARSLFTDSPNPADYEVSFEQNVLLIARKRHLDRTQNENYPVWIGITTTSPISEVDYHADSIGQSFSTSTLNSSLRIHNSTFVFVAVDTKSQTIALAKYVAQNYTTLIEKRKKRMEDLLNYSYVRTNNKRFDKALYWAKISMDALIMNQRGKGIFAGLPWFDNYWGRDSFISLPGATLVTGNFKDAKEILKSFAAWQDTNPSSTNYGRIPNLVTTNSIAYNTADGTPRFVSALYNYIKYSGDTTFMREMYPVVKRSIEGTIKYHMDSLDFLTHGDAETWMDAVGPDGPWSPRGNRAVDIQSLWWNQLVIAADMAFALSDKMNNQLWKSMHNRMSDNFKKYFIDTTTGLYYDHLSADGTPNKQVRPNQLFAYGVIGAGERMLRTVTNKLVYRYGIASLSQDDENFHPYHNYEPYYVPDAAYHNGIVWQWLSGRWIDLVAEYSTSDCAFQVTDNMVCQILERGAIGTLSELIDAAPRKDEKEPRLSGAYSQAWSIAEFIRTFYQTYLGLNPSSEDKSFYLSSFFMPRAFTSVDFRAWMKNSCVDFQYFINESSFVTSAQNFEDGENIKIDACAPINKNRLVEGKVALSSGESIRMTFNEKGIKLERGTSISYIEKSTIWERKNTIDSLELATPQIRHDLKCLRIPSHRLLSNSEIKQTNPQAKILYDVRDPEGSDNGSGSYIYPQTPNLKPGSLDVTHFTVSADEKNIYFKLQFKNLSNPGWHPEYGFQLTYAAIAINKGKENGADQVGMNSNYTFTDGFCFQDIIYVGGGFRIVNDSGIILAEYLPASGDVKNPLGNANAKIVEFSIPIELIGKPYNSWRYAVLIGCQDDHGGAGIGEFRNVEIEAKEWVGGGKKNPNDPNVYDVILPQK